MRKKVGEGKKEKGGKKEVVARKIKRFAFTHLKNV